MRTPPQLPRTIPGQLRIIKNPNRISNLACALRRLGVFQWNGDVLADVETSLTAYAKTLGKRLVGHSYSLNLTDDYASNIQDGYEITQKPSAIALLGSLNPATYDPRRTVKTLEAILPTLGWTVLQVMEETLDGLTGCCGPWKALSLADHLFWLHHGNEEAAREEMADQQEVEPHEATFELTRAEFEKEFPYGMFQSKKLPTKTIQACIPKAPQRLRPLLEATLEFMEWNRIPNDLFEINAHDRPESFILFWKPWGMVGRVYDDYINGVYECGSLHDYAALCAFNPDQEDSILTAFQAMNTLVDRLARAIEVLPLLGKRIYQTVSD